MTTIIIVAIIVGLTICSVADNWFKYLESKQMTELEIAKIEAELEAKKELNFNVK